LKFNLLNYGVTGSQPVRFG